MGIADRIILTLYTILMTVASVLTLLCSLGVFSDTGMVAFISHIPGNWVYAVGGVIMLLVSVRLLITGLGLTGVSSAHWRIILLFCRRKYTASIM